MVDKVDSHINSLSHAINIETRKDKKHPEYRNACSYEKKKKHPLASFASKINTSAAVSAVGSENEAIESIDVFI